MDFSIKDTDIFIVEDCPVIDMVLDNKRLSPSYNEGDLNPVEDSQILDAKICENLWFPIYQLFKMLDRFFCK